MSAILCWQNMPDWEGTPIRKRFLGESGTSPRVSSRSSRKRLVWTPISSRTWVSTEKQKAPRDFSRGAFFELFGRVLSPCADAHKGLTSVLGRPGSVLLSRGLGRSTMDAEGFDGRVRNGIG